MYNARKIRISYNYVLEVYSLKSISIRLDDHALHKKLKYICEYEGRSANKQIIYLIRQCITDFEKKNGVIKKPTDD